MKVLVAEDEFLVREVTCEDFADAGFEVVAAASGEEALAVFIEDPSFALLFTDIRMPGAIDGWELGARARALKPGLKVIYASGYTDAVRELAAGEAFLHKPYRWSEIAAKLAALGLDPQAASRRCPS